MVTLTFINITAKFFNPLCLTAGIDLVQQFKTIIMKRFFSLVLILLPSILSAQKATIKGQVIDTAAKKSLAFSTVSLVKASDSTLATFTRADSSGRFQLKSIPAGKYRLSASYVGYHPAWIDVMVNENDDVVDAGNVVVHDLKSMANVTVITKRPPVVVNGDTLEFNTENFRTQPNAVVEDILKKMPGITVDPDGTVRVNGQRINRVLVNGKEFFTGDPKMATKNLPADAIDKVQVFDKKSDRAEFTGVDDGNSEKAINLKMKADRNNALFGKITAGAGSDNRYDGQFNINRFKGEKQVSLLGMGNNTNRQGFSFNDALSFSGDMMRNMRGGGGGMVIRTGGGGPGDDSGLPVTGGGNNQQGVAKTYAGGANYNNKWGKNTDVNASYIFNDQSLLTNRDVVRQNIIPGNNFNYLQSSKTQRDNLQHRINASIDHKIDSFNSVKLTSSATYQKSKTIRESDYLSETLTKAKINEGFSNSINNAEGFNLRNNLLYRKRFAKRGRTFSLNLNFNLNKSEGDEELRSNNGFYDRSAGTLVSNTNLNQSIDQDAINRSYGGTAIYTEPFGKSSLIEASYFYNTNVGESEKQTWDFNGTSGKHDLHNSLLSNNFESNYTYTGGSLNVRTQKPKWTYNFGASLQEASLKSLVNKSQTIRQSFTDVLPNSNISYKFNNYRTLRLDYSTTTRQPSVSQLQPVPDVSDPLNIREGNPALKREYNHNMNINYFAADPATRKNFFVFASLSKTNSAIVSNDQIDPATGVRKTRPLNSNGVYNIFSAMNTGFPVRKLKSRVELGTSVAYLKNVSFINNNRNNIGNLSITPNVTWTFSIDTVIDIHASARISYNDAKYSLQQQQNTKYWQQQYVIEMINYLPWGLILNNNFTYIKTSGRAQGYNTSVPFWNASIAKGFLKNKRAEFKLSAFDILNENIGITRNANQNYIEDIRYNVLKRYFLLSFTYSLNKSGLNTGPRAVIRTF